MAKLPVLFLPGTLCTPALFESSIKVLALHAPRIDVVHFKLEDSMSKMADMAIEYIGDQNAAAIIGFSMGGMVAMEIIRKAPESIGKLALLNSNCHADLAQNRSDRVQHLRQARSEGMGDVIRQHYLDRYLYQPVTTARELILDMAYELGAECFEAQIKALAARPDSAATLSGIKCPTLILGADEDEMCPRATQTQMAQIVKNSELVMLKNCGHFSMLEKPAEVNQALSNWYLNGDG